MQFFPSKKSTQIIKSDEIVAIKTLPRGECIVELNSAAQDAVIFNQREQRFLPSGIHKFSNESFDFILFLSDFTLETQWRCQLNSVDKIVVVGGNITVQLVQKEDFARHILLEYRDNGQILNYPNCVNHIIKTLAASKCQQIGGDEILFHLSAAQDFIPMQMANSLLEEAGLNLLHMDLDVLEQLERVAPDEPLPSEEFNVEQLNLPPAGETAKPQRPEFSTKKEYRYIKDGDRKGPFSAAEVQELIDVGEIQPKTKIWKVGMSQWESVIDLGIFYFDNQP